MVDPREASPVAVVPDRPRARPAGGRRARYAAIEAVLEGSPAFAIVRRDGSVVADQRLGRRLAVLAALGESLATGRPARVGLDPLSSVLTVVRACDGACSVTFFDDLQATTSGSGLEP